jgi:hypothetical protein
MCGFLLQANRWQVDDEFRPALQENGGRQSFRLDEAEIFENFESCLGRGAAMQVQAIMPDGVASKPAVAPGVVLNPT